MNPDKPKMPEEKIVLILGPGIKAKLLNDFARYSSGSMIMSVNRGEVTGDNGEKLGFVSSDISSPGVQVGIYTDGDDSCSRSWHIDAEQLFAAVLVADEAREKELKK